MQIQMGVNSHTCNLTPGSDHTYFYITCVLCILKYRDNYKIIHIIKCIGLWLIESLDTDAYVSHGAANIVIS